MLIYLVYFIIEFGFKKVRDYECTALTNWATGPTNSRVITLNLYNEQGYSFI